MRTTLLSILFCAFAAVSISAQTTAFTYQGSLQSSGLPANGSYDLEFKMFDLASGGTQYGSTLQRLSIPVANGVFAVSLDFGPTVFQNGADRYLDIAVRAAGGGTFTPLTPRQKIDAVPYAVKSLTSSIADTVFVSGIPGGSGNYIQNGTSQQTSSNFNISGSGAAGGSLSAPVINADTEYDIAGVRILSNPGSLNIFAGSGAGAANTSGAQNSFFGGNTGLNSSTGSNNSFFGTNAGINNTTGSNNAFFGSAAGLGNSTATANAFFGVSAGQSNTASNNSFFGAFAGQSNSTGTNNAFFGRWAGLSNSTGTSNALFGVNAGQGLTTGSNNTLIGTNSNVSSPAISYGTAIGSDAVVGTNNTVVIGRSGGQDAVQIPGNLAVNGTINGNGSGLTNLPVALTLTTVTTSFNAPGGAFAIGTASCPSGSKAVGGGYSVPDSVWNVLFVVQSHPNFDSTGWYVRVANGAANSVTAEAWVVCARLN